LHRLCENPVFCTFSFYNLLKLLNRIFKKSTFHTVYTFTRRQEARRRCRGMLGWAANDADRYVYKKEEETRMDKSEIKKAYKQAKLPMGVYRIRNSQNDKEFIGFATNLPGRFNRHKAELKFGSHRNRELQEIWNSFGESFFEFEILDVLDHEEDTQTSPDEELHVLAEMWVQKLKKEGNSIVYLKKG
jgi:GIY-YIG catalytic domain-containing protein